MRSETAVIAAELPNFRMRLVPTTNYNKTENKSKGVLSKVIPSLRFFPLWGMSKISALWRFGI